MTSTDAIVPSEELAQVRLHLERLAWCRDQWSAEDRRRYDELAAHEVRLIAGARQAS